MACKYIHDAPSPCQASSTYLHESHDNQFYSSSHTFQILMLTTNTPVIIYNLPIRMPLGFVRGTEHPGETHVVTRSMCKPYKNRKAESSWSPSSYEAESQPAAPCCNKLNATNEPLSSTLMNVCSELLSSLQRCNINIRTRKA